MSANPGLPLSLPGDAQRRENVRRRTRRQQFYLRMLGLAALVVPAAWRLVERLGL